MTTASWKIKHDDSKIWLQFWSFVSSFTFFLVSLMKFGWLEQNIPLLISIFALSEQEIMLLVAILS